VLPGENKAISLFSYEQTGEALRHYQDSQDLQKKPITEASRKMKS